MPNLQDFNLGDMAQLSAWLRTLGADATSMEETAGLATRCLHDALRDERGEPACALVRFWKTHPYGDLPADLQASARVALGGVEPWAKLRCLTLLASAGARPEWCSREGSRGHRSIPLFSAGFLESTPMVANLVHQFGLDTKDLLDPSPELFLPTGSRLFNVFHVADARKSAIIPAQDTFVAPFGVRSVVGFGGPLPSGDIYAMILFSRVPVDAGRAQLFKTLSLSVQAAVIPHDHRVFA